jgi:hypothetical protein
MAANTVVMLQIEDRHAPAGHSGSIPVAADAPDGAGWHEGQGGNTSAMCPDIIKRITGYRGLIAPSPVLPGSLPDPRHATTGLNP